GVEVAGECVRTHAQRFERNGAAAGERVRDKRAGAVPAAERLVSGLSESAARLKVFADGGVVPVGEVGDEVQQRLAQLDTDIEPVGSFLNPHQARKAVSACFAGVVV